MDRRKEGWTAKKIDWTAVEQDFLTAGGSYRALAQRHGIALGSVRNRAASEHWQEKRRRLQRDGTGEPAAPEEQRRQRQARLEDAADEMLRRVLQAAEELEPGNAQALASLVRALKDLRELQGLKKDALDLEEQQARIERIRSQIRRDEEEECVGGVVLLPVPDETDREETAR